MSESSLPSRPEEASSSPANEEGLEASRPTPSEPPASIERADADVNPPAANEEPRPHEAEEVTATGGETPEDDGAPTDPVPEMPPADHAAPPAPEAAPDVVPAATDAEPSAATESTTSTEPSSTETAEPTGDAAAVSAEAAPETPTAPTEAEAPTEDATTGPREDDAAPPREGAPAEAKPPRKPPKRERRAPPKPQRVPLTLEQQTEARENARQRILGMSHREEGQIRRALGLLLDGRHIVYIARFRRAETGGLDERTLRSLRDKYDEVLHEEERRMELKEVLRSHGALDEKTSHRLDRAPTIPAMEDVAAPHLPVVAGRATVARGQGLEPLADAIRKSDAETVLSDLAKPFVKEGEGEEPNSLDSALAGARDILAEEMSLNADLRARLRKIFRKEATLNVGLRTERKGDPGRHKSLVGFNASVSQVPPLKFLAIRRAEKDRVLVTTIEPPEEAVLPVLQRAAGADDHPNAGFLRAAMEDGYRRILKPLYQAEIRSELKRRADQAAMETFERNLRHRLLGPVGGACHVVGLRPDVQQGHRWCAIDPEGLPTGSGQLPHEGTAGREACLTELREVLRTYEAQAVAVGSGGGRGEALGLVQEAVQGAEKPIDVAVVPDGGTHMLEAQGKLEIRDRPEIPPECRGAFSLARRFQDPLRELVTIDPKALALGPHLHEVHQGRLRELLDETVASCVAYVGVDPNHASIDLLGRVPGFDRASAAAFNLWRTEHGNLMHKAALAAVPGVGTSVAEQAVGFLMLSDAGDPRDRAQLHPEHYGVVEKMAEHAGVDLPTLFDDPQVRARLKLAEIESDEMPMPLLKYVLYQVTAGHLDDRPRFTNPIPPPEGLTLQTLQPGLIIEGRVVRAMPFGVFVDVGMGTDALIPTPHIGEHPGIDPSTVAPIGAVIQARVLEVIPEKRRLTLTMRRDRIGGYEPRGRPQGRGGFRREGGPRGGTGPRSTGGPRGGTGPRDDARRGAGAGAGRGDRRGGGGERRPSRKPQRKPGKYGGGGIGEIFSGRRPHHDRGTPRTISLGPDEGKPKDAEERAEKDLTPEELMAKKLADLKRKFGGEADDASK